MLIDDRRGVRRDFDDRLLAARLFKLICHQPKIVQHRMESLGASLKSISVAFWAWAVLDCVRGSEGWYYSLPVKQITIVRAF